MAQTNSTKELDFFEKVGYSFSLAGELINALKRNWIPLLVIYLVPTIATSLLVTLAGAAFSIKSSGIELVNPNLLIVCGALILFTLLVSILLFAPLTLTQLASVKGQSISLGDAIKKGLPHTGRMLGLLFVSVAIISAPFVVSLVLTIIFIGFLLLPVALVWAVAAAFFLSVAPYVLIDKKLSITDTIKESYRLVKIKWQWVLAGYLVTLAVAIATGFVSYIPIIGLVVPLAASLIYFLLPAYLYVHKINPNK